MQKSTPTKKRIPKLCKNGKTAFAEVKGTRYHFGQFGTLEAEGAYRTWVADFVRNGYKPPMLPAPQEEVTVCMLCAHFIERREYPTYSGTHQCLIKSVIRTLNQTYGDTLAKDFGAVKLETMGRIYIEGTHSDPPKPLLRREVSKRLSLIKRIFKYAVARELIPVEYHMRLNTLEPLQAGRCDARESERVKPVSRADVDAVIPHLPRTLQAVVKLQLLSGARACEILNLTPGMFDKTGKVWTVKLERHKTLHHGKERYLYFGGRAQEILRPFMLRDSNAPLFDPREAVAQRYAMCPTHRRVNQKPNERMTDRTLNDRYSTEGYGKALRVACRKAGIPAWHSHQLRHAAATLIRKEFGLEAARVILGHSTTLITETYAELDRDKAVDVMAQIG